MRKGFQSSLKLPPDQGIASLETRGILGSGMLYFCVDVAVKGGHVETSKALIQKGSEYLTQSLTLLKINHALPHEAVVRSATANDIRLVACDE